MIDNCRLSGCRRNGVTLRGFKRFRISGCYFENIAAQSIDSEPPADTISEDLVIVSNVIEPSLTNVYDMTLTGSSESYPIKRVTVVGNVLKGGSINVIRNEGTSIIGNIIKGTSNSQGKATIYCNYHSRDIVIANNRIIAGTSLEGIYLVYSGTEYPSGYVIVGNAIEATHGIVLQGADNVIVQGNQILGRGADGSHGIRMKPTRIFFNVVVAGNLIRNFVRAIYGEASSTRTGTNISITDNLFDDDQGAPTQTTGIYFAFSVAQLTLGANTMGRGISTPQSLQSNQSYKLTGSGTDIYCVDAAPTLSAGEGSLALRRDGTNGKLYVRENGSWVQK